MSLNIPFNKPAVVGNELRYIREALLNGCASGNGAFTKACHRHLEETLGVSKALLTTSCTDALEMSAVLLGIGAGDEVIVPSFTFVTTANAFALHGATPVFADIRPDTLNIDESRIEELITPRTRAIVPVHYAGVGCEMDRIREIADAHNLVVIEDNAHGLFGKYKGKPLGTFGEMATLSFHETKNIGCGEGGALLLNDPDLVKRAEIIWEKGTNRGQFVRGEVAKYTWVDIGASYLPSDLVAAYLLGQLEQQSKIQEKRRKIWSRYYAELKGWAREHGVRLPIVPVDCDQAYHMFYMLMPTEADRTELIEHLGDHGVYSVFHYVPLHNSPMGLKMGGGSADCPVTERMSARLVRLPFYFDFTDEEQDRVIGAVQSAFVASHRQAM